MSTGVECMAKGCPKEARWQIGFRIWPAGVSSRSSRNSVEGLTGCCVCDEHAVRDLDKFFTSKAKEQMAVGFLNAGRGMPDFATAEVVHTEITEGEPITIEQAAQLGGFPDTVS